MSVSSWNLINTFLSSFAVIISIASVWWTYQRFRLAPKRDIVRRYAGNLWRTSPDAPTGTSKDPFNDAMNEARVVFAGHKEIFESIQNIMTLDYYDYRQHDPILKMMAKEAGLSTKHWPDRAFEKVIV